MEGPRGTRKEEFDQVLKLVNYVFRESNNQPSDMEKRYLFLFNEDNLENLRIILKDNRPISHIGISEAEIIVYGCRTKIGSIGSVCTYPQYRGRGFATLLLENTIKKLDDDGADVMLVSGEGGLYKRAGCTEAGRVHKFRISGGDLKKFHAKNVKVFPYEEKNLENIVRVYQKERVRFFRSLEDFKRILTTGLAMDREAEILTIHKANEFLGYLAVQIPKEKEGKERISNVAEYSGIRRAILGVVKPIFDRYDIEELSFNIPFHDVEFIYALREKGFKSRIENIPGTMKIINFPRLMARFRPYIEERLGKKTSDLIRFNQEKDRFTIGFGREEFDTDARRLAQIVFGTPGKEEIMVESRKIAKILKEIFPLPFIWPGLNCV
ncbi:GNAT family N-acetyltransferase [Candidatus Aerophobetes bacterium]|nr:GNAT family N-acetyltransferase [Candidatus Aerophobetes bacterium]